MTLSAWLHTRHLEAVVGRDQPQRMPFVGFDRRLLAADLAALALVDAVEAHRIVERIGAHDVVVVGALRPEQQAGHPGAAAAERLEAQRGVDVAGHRLFGNAQGEAQIRRIAGGFGQGPAVGAVGVGDGLPVGRSADAGHALGAGDPAVGRGQRHDELGGGGRGEEGEHGEGEQETHAAILAPGLWQSAPEAQFA